MNTDKLVELFREEVEKLEKEAYERGKRDALEVDKPKTIKRKAKVGERVLITNPWYSQGYDLSDIGTVSFVVDRRGGVYVEEWEAYVALSEYEVIIEEPVSANQQRKELIEQAGEFVEKSKNSRGRLTNRLGYRNKYGIICDAEFIVNEEKRTVVALLKEQMMLRTVTSKGIAKCHPDEVFNADIGKAIALARALEIDVPKEFLNAVQPDEVVHGTLIKYEGNEGNRGFIKVIDTTNGDRKTVDVKSETHLSTTRSCLHKIINDTNAKY